MTLHGLECVWISAHKLGCGEGFILVTKDKVPLKQGDNYLGESQNGNPNVFTCHFKMAPAQRVLAYADIGGSLSWNKRPSDQTIRLLPKINFSFIDFEDQYDFLED